MNDLLAALLLGIIEGITEFLPISSTGHLLIAERWLGHRSDLFNIAIQAGAILAVVLIYWQRLVELALGWRQRDNRDYALKLGLAFAVTAVLGMTVKKLGFELPETIAPIAWALLLGGFVMLAAEAIAARRAADDGAGSDAHAIRWPVAALVGVAQVVAGVFPGTSRSAAAIFAALLFGRGGRIAATEFAFLVGIPTMFAATGYELLDTLKDGSAQENWTLLAVAFVASAVTAFVAVKWLLGYIQTHRFTIFAWYRIVLGAALLVWLGLAPAESATASAPRVQGAASAQAEALTRNSAAPTATIAATAISWPAITGATSSAGGIHDNQAMFVLVRKCLRDASLRRGLAFRPPLGMAEHGMGGVSEEDRRKWAAQREREVARLARERGNCAGVEAHLLDGSAWQLALAAADAGDADAAFCYVGAQLPMSQGMYKDPAELQDYLGNARRLLDAGMARGDWRMVDLALVAYNPMNEPRQGMAPYDAYEGPSYSWLSRVTKGDAVRMYALLLLQSLGAKTAQGAEGTERTSAIVRDWISDAQAQEAERWALRTFQEDFHGRRAWEQGDGRCLG